MRRSELLLSRKFLIGILIWIAILIPESEPLRGSALVLQAKTKAAEPKPETDDEIANNNGSTSTTNVTKSLLTGIPQIDYILDPNLPRELNGHNLTDYPFYSTVPDPEEIDFKCDGLHDGFYASVPHKCQVYHHCLFGTRYDFLCANYTAFDQKTFICHFVSEVDCDNSPKYFKRNEALYKEATTTTTTTTTTTPTPSTTTTVNPLSNANGGGMRHGGGGGGGRRRRPYYRRRRPVHYEYYYDDEEYADSEYYDDDVATMNHRRNPSRKQNKDHYGDNHNADGDYDSHSDAVKPSVRSPSGSGSVYERPRTPPKIRRPVPKNERDKYDYNLAKSSFTESSTTSATSTSSTTTTTERPPPTPASKSRTSTPAPATDEEYYDDDEYEYDEPKSSSSATHKGKHQTDYDFHASHEDSARRHVSRHRGRAPVRKHADMYDDYDLKQQQQQQQRPKMSRRKEHTRYDADRPRNPRPSSHRGASGRQQDEPAAPSYSKKRPSDTTEHRRRTPEKQRPSAAPVAIEDDYYYDDEEEEEEPLPPPPPPPKRQRRPSKVTEKPAKTSAKTSHAKSTDRVPVEPKQYESTTKYAKSNFLRGTKSSTAAAAATFPDNEETPRENEIPTTEHLGARTTLAYKTVKIVNNSLKDDDDDDGGGGADNVSTEETKSSLAQARPQGYVAVTRMLPKQQQPPLQESRRSTLEELSNRGGTSISVAGTPVRHFVFMKPIRKPSHSGYFANSAAASPPAAVNVSYRDESQMTKLPDQSPKLVSASGDYYHHGIGGGSSGAVTHFVKIPLHNGSAYQPVAAHGAFYVPMVEQTPPPLAAHSRKVKPVDEPHLPDTLNVITNGITYSGALVTEAKPFDGGVKPQAYRQDHRLYAVGDRLYTNSITFPHQAPSNYDITAPGPSAPADESNTAAAATAPTAAAPDKKYPELSSYHTANGDYDVIYNDALQPSTTHAVRRFPTTTFYVQNGPAAAPSRRLPADYAFNESAFNSLNRSHSRYK